MMIKKQEEEIETSVMMIKKEEEESETIGVRYSYFTFKLCTIIMAILTALSAVNCFKEGPVSICTGILMIIAGVLGVIATMRKHYFITAISSALFLFVSVVCLFIAMVDLYEIMTGKWFTFKTSESEKLIHKEDITPLELTGAKFMFCFFMLQNILYFIWWYVWNEMSKLFDFEECLLRDEEECFYFEEQEDELYHTDTSTESSFASESSETRDVMHYEPSIDLNKAIGKTTVGKIFKHAMSSDEDESEYLM